MKSSACIICKLEENLEFFLSLSLQHLSLFTVFRMGVKARTGEVMIDTIQRFEDKTLLAEGRTSRTRSGDSPPTGLHHRYVVHHLIQTNSKSFFVFLMLTLVKLLEFKKHKAWHLKPHNWSTHRAFILGKQSLVCTFYLVLCSSFLFPCGLPLPVFVIFCLICGSAFLKGS